MTQPLIIYHGNCLDGFGAAYAAQRYFLKQSIEAEYFPASHGEDLPECAAREVYVVDFSYKRPIMKQLCEVAERVIVLDHHISAQEDLAGLETEYDNLEIVFDMSRSGAVITWEYLHQQPVPKLLLHVQDQDLWNFDLDGTRDINAALMSYPFDFALWHEVVSSDERFNTLLKEGEAINRFRREMIDNYKERAVIGTIAGYQVPVVNCPRAIISELVGELAEGHPFAAGYQDKGEKRSWSLRSSRNGGEDVAKIAGKFGGGGHKNAAGFGTQLPTTLLHLEPEEQ
ncbi:MAG: DHHA1 domain-containing protein [Chromatiales bacterium]|nr:DHHA1 domain-containing protein [Chromatiales bacterium]